MATKKEKRQRALAKHEAMMEEYRLSGLEAQRKDREQREKRRQLAEAEKKRRQDSEASKLLNAIFGTQPSESEDEAMSA